MFSSLYNIPKRQKANWKVTFLLLAMIICSVILTIYNPVLALIRTELGRAELSFFSVSNGAILFCLDVGRYPSSQEGLSALYLKPNDISSEVWRGPYLKKPVLKDIWGQNYQYTYPGIHNKNSFDLLSFGRDGIEGTVDDINNWDENESWRNYYIKNKPWDEYWYEYWYEYYHIIISFSLALLISILLEIIRIIKLKKRD